MGQTSSGIERSITSNDTGTSFCLFCENPRCYVEVGDVTPPERHTSLNDLAEKFQGTIEKAKSLGLQELIEPIGDTVVTLKNLADRRHSESLNLSRSSCNCNHWGPDDVTPQGDWICNICGDKCQCDKAWCIPPVGSRGRMSSKCDPEVRIENYEGNVIGESMKESIEDDIRKYDNDNEIELSLSSRSKASQDARMSVDTWSMAEGLMENKRSKQSIESSRAKKLSEGLKEKSLIERSFEDQQSNDDGGAKCPCGCEYYQEGEFKVCPCGCGTIIEIVDNTSEIKLGGPCCLCGPQLQDEQTNYPNELSRLSLATNETGLMTALEMLRAKCRIKDGIIAILAEELRNSKNVDHIVDNLAAPCLPYIAIDFNRSMLCEYLSSRSRSDLYPGEHEKQDDTVLPPLNFRVTRSILNSLFVAWDPPEFLCGIRGYEILVNGIVTCRVTSPTRSQAILTCVDLTKPSVLTIYSIAINGHISDSLTITFPADNAP